MPEIQDQGQGAPAPASASLTPDEINRLVNSAVTAQLKRSIPQALTEALGSLKLDEKIAELVTKAAPQKPPEGGNPPDPKQVELEQKLVAMQRAIEATEARAREAEERRTQAEAAQRRDRGRAELTAALQGKVRPEAIRAVVDLLDSAYKRVEVNEDGQVTLQVERPQYKGGPLEKATLPLSEALPVFLQSPEAALFIPAPGGQPARGGVQPPVQRGVPAKLGENASDADRSALVNDLLARNGVDPSGVFR